MCILLVIIHCTVSFTFSTFITLDNLDLAMENLYKELTEEDCHTVLHNDLKDTNAEIVSYSINPFSDKIEGLLGQHFKLEITYKFKEALKTNHYFMKVLNGSSKTIFDMCMSINAYGKEDFFYNVLVKEFRKFDIDISFVPQCYFSKPYLIILEDVSLKNYFPIGTLDFTLDHCKKALKTVAKLHSGNILYENQKSKDLGKPFNLYNAYPNILKNFFFDKESNMAKDWLYKSCDGVYELIKFIPENHIKNEEFQKKFLGFVNRMESIEPNCKSPVTTILHGDLWTNNFLFGSDDSILIDFQIVRYGPPTVDVMNFLFSNTRKQFRDAHKEELFDYYYECVESNLIKHEHSDIPSKSQFLWLNSDLNILIKLLCLCDRTVTLMFDDDDDGVYETDEGIQTNLFDDRTASLIRAFNKHAAFREIIEEDMLELRDLLCQNV